MAMSASVTSLDDSDRPTGASVHEPQDGIQEYWARNRNHWLHKHFAQLSVQDELPVDTGARTLDFAGKQRDDARANSPGNSADGLDLPATDEDEDEDEDDEHEDRDQSRRCPCCQDKGNKCNPCSVKGDESWSPCHRPGCVTSGHTHRRCWTKGENDSSRLQQVASAAKGHNSVRVQDPNRSAFAHSEDGYHFTHPQDLIAGLRYLHLKAPRTFNIIYQTYLNDHKKKLLPDVLSQAIWAIRETIDKADPRQSGSSNAATARQREATLAERESRRNINTNKCHVLACTCGGKDDRTCVKFADHDCEASGGQKDDPCSKVSSRRCQASCSCDRKGRKRTCRGEKWVRSISSDCNINRVACPSRRQKLNNDLLRVTDQNFCLSALNYELRNSIRCVRQSTMSECARILDAIINYCECKSNEACTKTRKRKKICPPRDNCRVGAGCSAGTCGGYTPSGWNKLLTKHSLECTDPCCRYCCPPCPPCPNCTGPCPCAINCTCPCPFPRPRSSSPCSRSKKKSPNASENASNSWAPSEDTQSNSCCQRPSTKILGELAFQLERRILDYVFGLDGSKRRRFYGYTVSNICEMMEKECKHSSGTEDQFLRTDLAGRLKKILSALHTRGYKIDVHGEFAQETVNKYGLLSSPPDPQTIQEFGLQDPACIASLISQLATGPAEVRNLTILLNSLKYLAKCDGRPLFVW